MFLIYIIIIFKYIEEKALYITIMFYISYSLSNYTVWGQSFHTLDTVLILVVFLVLFIVVCPFTHLS